MPAKIPCRRPDGKGAKYYKLLNFGKPFSDADRGTTEQPTAIAGSVHRIFPYNAKTKVYSVTLKHLDSEETCVVDFQGSWAQNMPEKLQLFTGARVYFKVSKSMQFQRQPNKANEWAKPKVVIKSAFEGGSLVPGVGWMAQFLIDPAQLRASRDATPQRPEQAAQVSADEQSGSASDDDDENEDESEESEGEKENQDPEASDDEPEAGQESPVVNKKKRARGSSKEKQPSKKPRGLKALTKGLSEILKVDKREYLPLGQINEVGDHFSTIAVVTTLVKKQLVGSVWKAAFWLYDPTMPDGHLLDLLGTPHTYGLDLPEDIEDGDVVVFQNINLKKGIPPTWHGYFTKRRLFRFPSGALLNNQSIDLRPSTAYTAQVGAAELARAKALATWWQMERPQLNVKGSLTLASGNNASGSSSKLALAPPTIVSGGAGGFGRKTGKVPTLAQNITPAVFCIWTAEVLRTWHQGLGVNVTAHLTDYTENSGLVLYEPGSVTFDRPLGRRIIQVTFWEKMGDQIKAAFDKAQGKGTPLFVRLNNFRPKLNNEFVLEGSVYEHDLRGMDVLKPNQGDFMLGELLKRRSHYNKVIHYQITGEAAPDAAADEPETHAPVASTSAAAAVPPVAQARQSPTHVRQPQASKTASVVTPQPVASSSKALLDALDPSSSGPIKERFVTMSITTLEEAAALDQNCSARIQTRVYEIHPVKLEEWIVGKCTECGPFSARSAEDCILHKGCGSLELDGRVILGPPDLYAPADDEDESTTVYLQTRISDVAEFLPGFELTSGMARGERAELNKFRRRLMPLVGALEQAQQKGPDFEIPEECYGQPFTCSVTRISSARKQPLFQMHGISLHEAKH